MHDKVIFLYWAITVAMLAHNWLYNHPISVKYRSNSGWIAAQYRLNNAKPIYLTPAGDSFTIKATTRAVAKRQFRTNINILVRDYIQ